MLSPYSSLRFKQEYEQNLLINLLMFNISCILNGIKLQFKLIMESEDKQLKVLEMFTPDSKERLFPSRSMLRFFKEMHFDSDLNNEVIPSLSMPLNERLIIRVLSLVILSNAEEINLIPLLPILLFARSSSKSFNSLRNFIPSDKN